VPHWGDGDPVALDVLDVSAAGALLAVVAEETLSKPGNLFTVPHWGDGDPVALDALDVSAAGALLAVVAEETLSKPGNLFTVPHWGDGDPAALGASDVSPAGALLAVVAEKALSKPRNLFLASPKTKLVRRKNAFSFLTPRAGAAERSKMVSDFLRLDAISNSFRFEKNRTTK
jgi:hypothetical protein